VPFRLALATGGKTSVHCIHDALHRTADSHFENNGDDVAHLIEILVPVPDDDTRTILEGMRQELTATFGGVTMHVTAPAEGLWQSGGGVERDRIVIVEVMAQELDRVWWGTYRKELEARLHQDEIIIRSIMIERL
jgi:hypothetical protein